MKTIELIILNLLDKSAYKLNEEITDISAVVEYIDLCNEEATPDSFYTPEDWLSDTIKLYPEYLKIK